MYLQVHWVAPFATFTAQICTLLCGQTSASGNKPINNNIHLRFAICTLLRGQTSAEAVLCLLNPGIDQSTPIFICAPRYAHFFAVKSPPRRFWSIEFGNNQSTPISICAPRSARYFAVKRPRFAACCQATTNLRSNTRTEIKLPAI